MESPPAGVTPGVLMPRIRVIGVLAAVSLLLGLVSAPAAAGAPGRAAAPGRAKASAVLAAAHRRVRVHPVRLVPPAHPSLRVVQVRHARIVRVHGTTRRARVVPWPARG